MINLRRKSTDPVEVEHVYRYEDGSTEVETVRPDSEAPAEVDAVRPDSEVPAEVDAAQPDVDASTHDESPVSTRRASLAALLTEAGLASDEQIHEALEEGKQTGEKLGEVVLRRGWASERRLAQLLAEQWGLSAVDPGALSLDPLAVSRLEIGVASELGGFPVWFDQHGIVVAVSEPNEERFTAFRERLGNVTFVVVPRSTLMELVESRLFGAKDRGAEHGVRGADAGVSNTNGGPNVHGEQQLVEPSLDVSGETSQAEQHEQPKPVEQPEPAEQQVPVEVSSPLDPVEHGSLVERLRSIEVDVQALEQALGDSRRAAEAHEAELATLREARTKDLDRIRELEGQLAARSDRLRALRDKVADLNTAFED
jgi:hypothetical protein